MDVDWWAKGANVERRYHRKLYETWRPGEDLNLCWKSFGQSHRSRGKANGFGANFAVKITLESKPVGD